MLLSMFGALPGIAAEPNRVEVVLAAALDEPRGYCLDIVGYKARAQPSKGIHAHTCYSYQGALATDQAFDASDFARGVLRLPDWNVCLTFAAADAGAGPTLEACDASDRQAVTLTDAGEIVPRLAPGRCLTVDPAASRPGGGGTPAHLIRGLLLAPCTQDRHDFQRWRVRSSAG